MDFYKNVFVRVNFVMVYCKYVLVSSKILLFQQNGEINSDIPVKLQGSQLMD